MASTPLRLPTAPYPGLRPFLDHEDMLMHGRQSQVADVVQRLGRPQRAPADGAAGLADEAAPPTRFVAVIGGSGSGKSSLIRAGVVPYLRQFGIPEAGDLWESVVATPGTNFQPDADGQRRESPITRLAAKFERVLRGERDAGRRDAIAQTLRRPGGLGLLVELYGAELDLPASVRPETACVLIVIDQFEELFHKTNAGSADARALVERVIDHYHQAKHGQGSPRCFLAITMRSEHLNDCAGYLGLPEAINAGAYLVSRLDDAQVREVIEKPAQRYLRLRQRERQALARQVPQVDTAALPPLPAAVAFAPGVVERLVDDTRQIAHDPDHLPLLQHALARLWSVACAREGLGPADVPAAVTQADLWRAAQAGVDTPPEAGQNLLRLSLDRWAERALQDHPEAERAQVLDLLRRLAYKDTRTGTYNQQRLYVAGHPLGAERLQALIRGRWIDGVDYLHWDDEDPQRVTLKVSHESFIRGWATLRQLADREAWRLEQFITLLAATQRWADKGRPDRDLLEQRLLDLLDDAQIDDALGTPGREHDGDPDTATWHDWQAWLAQLPQGPPLQAVARLDARRFLRRSQRAQAEAARSEHAHTRNIAALSMFLAVAGLAAAFAIFVQLPVLSRAQHYFAAAGLANRAALRIAQPEVGGSLPDLAALLAAADELRHASTPAETWFAGVSDTVLNKTFLRRMNLADLMPRASRTVEPVVNGKLREVLTRALWRTSPEPPADGLIDDSGQAPISPIGCSGDGEPLYGTLKPVEGSRAGDAERRGIFIADSEHNRDDGAAGRGNQLMYSATLKQATDGSPARCELGRQLLALPGDRAPAVMFDALLGHMLLATKSDSPAMPSSVTVQRLRWDDPSSGSSAELHPPLAVVFNEQAADALRRQVPQGIGVAAATWRMPGGRAMRVGDQAWRLVSESAQRLVPQPAAGELRPLQEAPAQDDCQQVAALLQQGFRDQGQPGSEGSGGALKLQLLAEPAFCLVILRVPLAGDRPDRLREQVSLQAFVRPTASDRGADGQLLNLTNVASVEFGRVRPADGRWFSGRRGGPLDGWLILERPDDQPGKPARYSGLPWSTAALARLGRDLRDAHCAVAHPAGPPPDCRDHPLPTGR